MGHTVKAGLAAGLLACVVGWGFWSATGDSMPTIKPSLVINHKGPRGAVFKLETLEGPTPPTYKTCWTRSGSNGGLGVALNSAGETHFGSASSDVNVALAVAATAAINQLVASADGTICDDGCQSLAGEGTGSEGGAIANITAIIGSYEEGDDLCDPLSIGGAITGLRVSATASVVGWNTDNFLRGINVDGFEEIYTPESIESAIDAILATNGLAVNISAGNWRAIVDPDLSGSPFVSFQRIDASTITAMLAASVFGGFFSATYNTTADINTQSGTITCTLVGGTQNTDPSGLPGSFSISWDSAVALEITDEYLELNNGGGDPETYVPTTSTNFTGSGSVTVALTDEHQVMVDPGSMGPNCRTEGEWDNPFPWLSKGCNLMERKALPYKHMQGKHLPCTILVVAAV